VTRNQGHPVIVPDTIVARATAAAPAALAVVRMSGPDALSTAAALVEAGGLPAPECVRVLWLREAHGGARLDQAVVTVFRAPRSYTGEDLVEFSLHGNPALADAVVSQCVGLGARHAEAGEFTRRAYLNGKLDLIQAEAVADLIEGHSERLRDVALDHLDRGLSRRLASLRERLVELEVLLTHHIDFPDEDEPPVSLERVAERAQEVLAELDVLVATAPEGELLREGALTVFAGPPNSGKSSLFNALMGHERAIVTEVPGTTRDAIEGRVSINGYPFLVVDTAGLRTSEDRIERMGIEVAEGYLERADLVVWCSRTPAEDLALAGLGLPEARVVRVRTQIDRGEDGSSEGSEGDAPVRVSAHTGAGLDHLRDALCARVFSGLAQRDRETPVVTRRRHREALELARAELQGFREGLQQGVPAEVAAAHLRPAATALEELLGVIEHEEILDRVFRDFCIGK